MASELGKVYVSPDHSQKGKFRIMPLKPDGTVNLNVYAQVRAMSFTTFEEAVKYAKGLVAHYGGTVESDTRGKSVNFRPGAKDTMASHKESFQKEYILWALPKGETDRLHERPIAEGITTPQQMDDAKRKAASQGWHGFRVQILDMSKPFRWMSRPGAKDKMAVEDRFYFGK